MLLQGSKGSPRARSSASRLICSRSSTEAVVFTGWIPRAKLFGLFEGARGLIAPSLFEGFGLPVLEAMAAGIPTACSAIAAFDSLAAESVLRFDPLSVPAIAAAMERIVTDSTLRARAAEDGPARARTFDWRLTAASTLRELLSAAAGHYVTRTDRKNIQTIASPPSPR